MPQTSSVLYTLAATAGVLTWLVLNKRNVLGHHAAVAYACAFAALYYALRLSSSFAENALYMSIGLAVAYGASALSATVAYRLSPWHPLAKFPGPRLWHVSSLWLTYVSIKGRRHLVIDSMHARYGVFVRIGPNILSINSPSAQYIYSASARMPKSDAYRMPGHDGVVALFFKQPAEKLHFERKRAWSGLFTKNGLSHVIPSLERRSFQLLDCMERRQEESASKGVNLADCFSHWSYDLMGDFVFSGCNEMELMRNGDPQGMVHGGELAMIVLDSIGQTPWLMDLAWRLPLGAPMRRLAESAGKMMDTRLQVKQPSSQRDLVSFLTEDGKIPDRDLRLDAIIAILAGSDNTYMVLTLAIYFATTQPKYYQQLRHELEQVFTDPTGPLHDEKFAQVPLLEAVITETLRLSTPYFLPRIVPEGGASIAERFIPEGTVVAQAAYSQQVDPENFYPDPLEFRPERWLPEGLGPSTKANRSAISSFSSGPHVCIAKQFAYQEMRHVLARVVLNMDIEPVKGFDAKAFRNGLLNMRTTIMEIPFIVQVKRRRDAVPVDETS